MLRETVMNKEMVGSKAVKKCDTTGCTRKVYPAEQRCHVCNNAVRETIETKVGELNKSGEQLLSRSLTLCSGQSDIPSEITEVWKTDNGRLRESIRNIYLGKGDRSDSNKDDQSINPVTVNDKQCFGLLKELLHKARQHGTGSEPYMEVKQSIYDAIKKEPFAKEFFKAVFNGIGVPASSCRTIYHWE